MRFHSFYDLISSYAEETPESPAFMHLADSLKSVSYLDFLHTVSARADELRDCGKTCLGVFTDSSLECITEVFAAVHAGLQVVMLDDNLPDAMLASLIEYTDVDILWGDDELKEAMEPHLTSGVTGGSGKILFFTSGTTDRSKAVVLTEDSLLASAWNGGALLPLRREDILLCMLPLNHVFGFVCSLLWGLSCGACVAVGRGPRHYHDDCMTFRPTALSAVPMLWGFLLKMNAVNPELKLVLIGAGDCPKDLIAAGTALGIHTCFGYGLTETSSGVALSTSGNPYAMEICPDDRILIAPDGEILINAPTCIMQGYYKMPEATEAALKDGILYTGDLGYIDDDQKLHINGRKKEMIVLSDGTKLFLPEYEHECREALGVEDLCIYMKDNILTLLVVSDTIAPGEVLPKLRDVFDARPRGQQIRRAEVRSDPLPKTATGKLKRWEIR